MNSEVKQIIREATQIIQSLFTKIIIQMTVLSSFIAYYIFGELLNLNSITVLFLHLNFNSRYSEIPLLKLNQMRMVRS